MFLKRTLKNTLFCIVFSAAFLCINEKTIGAENTDAIICFSPKGSCEETILSQIEKARGYIHIAMFHFTNGRIARTLVNAAKRGVEVKVILDEQKALDTYSKGNFLKKKEIKVQFMSGSVRNSNENRTGFMHNKFAVIDGKIVVTGSYNWTVSAETRNYENMLILSSPKIAGIFEKEFAKLWMEQ